MKLRSTEVDGGMGCNPAGEEGNGPKARKKMGGAAGQGDKMVHQSQKAGRHG